MSEIPSAFVWSEKTNALWDRYIKLFLSPETTQREIHRAYDSWLISVKEDS